MKQQCQLSNFCLDYLQKKVEFLGCCIVQDSLIKWNQVHNRFIHVKLIQSKAKNGRDSSNKHQIKIVA